MKFQFTADDFRTVWTPPLGDDDLQFIADRANALLEAEEAKCERVYGMNVSRGNQRLPLTIWSKDLGPHETHTALLWNIEPIKNENK